MLIDSNIFILAATGNHNHLLDFFRSGEAAYSAISRVEVLGFSRLNEKDEDELKQLLDLLTELPVGDDVIENAVRLRQRRKMSLGDSLIAGTALAHDLQVVTANEADFAWIEELKVINPMAG